MPKHYSPARAEQYRASEKRRQVRDMERKHARTLKITVRKNGK